jgi:hypothetical protein
MQHKWQPPEPPQERTNRGLSPRDLASTEGMSNIVLSACAILCQRRGRGGLAAVPLIGGAGAARQVLIMYHRDHAGRATRGLFLPGRPRLGGFGPAGNFISGRAPRRRRRGRAHDIFE